MDCKEFSRVMGDYVNRTLGEEIAERAKMHLDGCATCAREVAEMECTSTMVRSLGRTGTPSGFEERLKTRLAAQHAQSPSGAWAAIRSWVQAAGRSLWGVPGHRLAFGPALAALLFCAVIAGSLLVFTPDKHTTVADTDWAYINTCKDQHASFAGANPLGDESAAALRERDRKSVV
jgi:hypothetical protein